MSKCPRFLALANNFSDKLRQLTGKGVAMDESKIESCYRSVHEPQVSVLFPKPDPKNVNAIYPSTFPISYKEYMQGIAQPTDDEVVSFLSYMREEGMYVVDSGQLNRPEGLFVRIPPNPTLRAYDHLRFDASVFAKRVSSPHRPHGPVAIFIGKSIAYFNHNYQFLWECGWEDKSFMMGPYTNQKWEERVAVEEVKALLHGVREDSGGKSISNNNLSFKLGPYVNFIGDNLQVIGCFNGTCRVPDFLFTPVAKILILLKEYKGYAFSHEHREQNGISDFIANMRMRMARGDIIVPQQEVGNFANVVSEHYDRKTAFRFKS